MKRDTIQTVFDNIILSECGFRNDYVTIYSNYKEYTLEVLYDVSDCVMRVDLWLNESKIVLSSEQESKLINRIYELQAEYIENEKQLNEMRNEFYYDLGSKPYIKG